MEGIGDPQGPHMEDALLEDEQERVQEVTNNESEDLVPLEYQLNDSEDDVDDGGFQYQRNAHERVLVGLNADLQCQTAGEDNDSELDDPYYAYFEEELHTDHSSNEENNFRFPTYDAEMEKFNPQLEVGKEFKDIEEFKKAVRHYGVVTRRNLKFTANDEKRAQGVCKNKDCKWKIWASWNKNKGCVQIKTFNSQHTCIRDRINRHCTAKYIAEKYIETFKIAPDWKSELIIKVVRDDLKLIINRVTAWRARRHARILIEGSNEHQFGLLWSFAHETLRSNPGSTCIVTTHESKFQGVYIFLEACKRGFMSGCRQLLGLDGCFLKGNFGGQMLVAVALDANDCIYPVAYAIVETENARSWRWFVSHLGEDLRIVNSNEWTFMTDRQKGLQKVIEELYPDAEHRFYVRHMYTNFFRAEFKSLALKGYLWKAAKSTTVPDWKFWMDELAKESAGAFEWLSKKDPSEWSKSHFSTKVKSDIALNNLCEVFNNVVLEDREKSILTMLIDMHISCMKRIQSRRDKMRRVRGPLCPKIQQKLAKSMEIAEECEVEWSGGPQFYVKCRTGEYVVDLSNKTCACRRWDLTGIPCGHVVAVILDRGDNPTKYVHECYTVQTYLNCYENIVNPINGKKLWPEVNAIPIQPPSWVVAKRGRKQKKHRRQQEEDVMTQSGTTSRMKKKGTVTMTCSLCRLPGHNKRYHDRADAPMEDWVGNDLDHINQDGASQVESQRTRAKLATRRANKNSTNEVQLHDPTDGYIFIPTPGLRVTSDAQPNNNDPSK